MSENQMMALEINNFSYNYKSEWLGKSVRAVHNLSLDVLSGESFGFLGHNGAGKTTTIKAILGLTKPTTGSIKIFGEDNTHAFSRRQIGYLPEQPYFYDHLTVLELIEMSARLSGVESSKVRAAAMSALEKTHVGSRKDSKLRSLSKGLTQRVAMSQAIVHKPKLLILDEPFSGLDPIGRKEFKDLLFNLKSEGTTIFISSHILEDIEFLCDRASIMADGKVKLILKLSDLHMHASKRYELTIEEPLPESLKVIHSAISQHQQGALRTFVFDDGNMAKAALEESLAVGVGISNYRAAHGNLEDLFVKLVSFREEG